MILPARSNEVDIPSGQRLRRVLLIASGWSACRELTAALVSHGFTVFRTVMDVDGLRRVAATAPDLILFWQETSADRRSVRELRTMSSAPLVVVTKRYDEATVADAFEAGADDVVGEPLDVPVVIARIEARMRRVVLDRKSGAVLKVGAVSLDLRSRRVWVDSREVALTQLEFRLLALLARYAGTVVTREKIIAAVWGAEAAAYRTLSVHVSSLRRKLGESAAGPRHLHTVWRIGFRLGATRNG